MAKSSMDITSFVGKLLEEDDVDLLREGVRILAQALMETEVSSQIGAGPYERSSTEPPRGRIMSALGREWNAAAERGSS